MVNDKTMKVEEKEWKNLEVISSKTGFRVIVTQFSL